MKSIVDAPDSLFQPNNHEKSVEEVDQVTIRFAGDSGDGMQLAGSRFTSTTALFGNELATLPDFPAEIRAPAGTVAGVSGYQIHFSKSSIHTPGDQPEVLVAMNPAALKANIKDLAPHGLIILNSDTFTEANLKKAGYESDPREDGSLQNFRVVEVPITKLTREALKDLDISDKDKDRCKNMFALGLSFWMFDRSLTPTLEWIEKKFASKPEIAKANTLALRAGYNFADTTELLPVHFKVEKAELEPGTYRNITGNEALSLGVIAAASLSKTGVFLGAYPITPASDILHYLARYTEYGISVFQAEDEIAAICAAIGASYAGSLGITATSGPGMALKSEALNLAVMAELPLVVVNVQRGGPSTGLPTKPEQADLFQAMYGRNGESPVAVVAARSPVDCFYKVLKAFQLAVKYMAPVVLLSDGYLANGSESWRLPKVSELDPIEVKYKQTLDNADKFYPYERDEKTLARPWVKPGTPGLEHRIGGLEKEDKTGNVSYDPENHEKMVHFRKEKIQRMKADIPKLEVLGTDNPSDVLLVGWGSSYGAIYDARERLAKEGIFVHQTHFDYINPMPSNAEEVLHSYKTVIVPELNLGQFAFILQGTFAKKVIPITQVKGQPFRVNTLVKRIKEILGK
ncbi:MAG: 2-oxoacid:acceptor oxidoreductase subunit alpha [Candidatus Hydrogenedentota bacterium]|nr:MAG: 2-oxoacid:acceptor oxidoreductase subunit alpha [Candidatus Hydrogenedentota bacterium]